MVLVVHADAEVTWHAQLRVSTQAEVSNNQAQMEKPKMKTPVIKTPAHVRNTMGSTTSLASHGMNGCGATAAPSIRAGRSAMLILPCLASPRHSCTISRRGLFVRSAKARASARPRRCSS
jgi:hypothetical protein